MTRAARLIPRLGPNRQLHTPSAPSPTPIPLTTSPYPFFHSPSHIRPLPSSSFLMPASLPRDHCIFHSFHSKKNNNPDTTYSPLHFPFPSLLYHPNCGYFPFPVSAPTLANKWTSRQQKTRQRSIKTEKHETWTRWRCRLSSSHPPLLSSLLPYPHVFPLFYTHEVYRDAPTAREPSSCKEASHDMAPPARRILDGLPDVHAALLGVAHLGRRRRPAMTARATLVPALLRLLLRPRLARGLDQRREVLQVDALLHEVVLYRSQHPVPAMTKHK